MSTPLIVLCAVLLFAGAWLLPIATRFRTLESVRQSLGQYQLKAATASLRQWLATHPSDAEAHFLLATIARRNRDNVLFQKELDLAQEYGWDQESIDQQLVLLKTQLGDVNPAKEQQLLGSPLIQSNDDLAEQTYQAIATGYLTNYQLKEAWQCIEFWLQWRPEAVSGHLLRADIFERLNDNQNAIKEYRTVLETDPLNLEARQKLGRNLMVVNEVEQAQKILQGLVDEGDSTASTRIDLAEAYQRLGEPEKARKLLDGVNDFGLTEKQRSRTSLLRGQLILADGEPEKALADLAVAVELSPEEATAQFALSTAHSRLGNEPLAERHREQARKIQENFQQIRELTGKLIDQPVDPVLRTEIGRRMIEQGLVIEGLQWVRTALNYDPNFLPAIELMQRYSVDAQRASRAANWNELNPESPRGSGVNGDSSSMPANK